MTGVQTCALPICNTARYHYEQGDTYTALLESVEALRRDLRPKRHDRYALVLERAFNEEQVRILRRIDQKRATGDPSNWPAIYGMYANLASIQDIVAPFLPVRIHGENRDADIRLVDVAAAQADARLKAAEFLYAEGKRLIATGRTADAREAFFVLQELEETLHPGFRDARQWMEHARALGTNHALIRFHYPPDVLLPQAFVRTVENVALAPLEGLWVRVHRDSTTLPRPADHVIHVRVMGIDIGPEQVMQRTINEQAQVQDGTRPALDAAGNPLVDSTGAVITEPNMVTVTAVVQQTTQQKLGVMHGHVVIEPALGGRYEEVPIQQQLSFQNAYATFMGDPRALSAETEQMVNGAPLPFPTDQQMLNDAALGFQQAIFAALTDQAHLLGAPHPE